MAKSNQIENLIQAVEKLLSKEIAPVLPIAPIAPIAPVAPILQPNPEDHNLLIKLDTKVDALKEDIKMLNDGTNLKINDHETRIRDNEKNITKITTWGTAFVLIIGIVEFLINQFIAK